MKLNSKVVGIIVLVVMFGGIMATTALGWWQTEGGRRGNGPHGGNANNGSHQVTSLHGTVNDYDSRGITISTDDGQSLYVQLGNARYNQSIGFAPQVGEGVTISGFPGDQGLYNATTITLDSTGQVYAFRDETGYPFWGGGNGRGNGGNGNGKP
jgi:hypothetical protein